MTVRLRLGIVMDPIHAIAFKKDSSLAMLLEAMRRQYEIHYFEPKDLWVSDGKAYGLSTLLQVFDDKNHWYAFGDKKTLELSALDVILMRKDPPFDMEYIYLTHILSLAEKSGVLVINRPQSLRDYNEKLFTADFPDCSPKTLVTRDHALLQDFLKEQLDIVVKPLEGMGGTSVFRLRYPDVNANAIIDTLSHGGQQFMMAQKYLPEIVQGDKRILMINGEPIPYALARIPAEGDWRGNLAKGATGVAKPLTTRDRWLCEKVGPKLREKGLMFVGLDVIGDYITEINITSPTCIRELDAQCGLNISAILFDAIVAVR